MGDKKRLKAVIGYIHDTRRFEETHGNLQPTEENDEDPAH